MKIENRVKTCSACPAQWEFETDGGRMAYVRFQWGYLSVRVSLEPTNESMDAVRGPEVLGEQVGGEYDGTICWKEVEKRIKDLDVDEALGVIDLKDEDTYPTKVFRKQVNEMLKDRGLPEMPGDDQ